MRTRRLVLGAAAVLAGAMPMFAGVKFTAQPGEEVVPGQYIIRFLDPSTAPAIVNAVNPAIQLRAGVPALGSQIVQVPMEGENNWVNLLAQHPAVQWIEPLRKRKTQVSSPNDTSLASQWSLNTVEAVKAWGMIPGNYLNAAAMGTGRIRVAVLDTGMDCTHPDFKNAGGTSVDSAQGGQVAISASRAYVTTTRPSPPCVFMDDHGHGTHTAGTVAAATHNAVGVAALGFPLELMIYKVLDGNGIGDDVTISAGIIAAVDNGAKIISMSLGGSGYSQTFQDALQYAWQRDVMVIAAAGNSNSSNLFYPAGSNYALGVAASDSSNNKAGFSNYGNYVGIAAPGVGILSTMTTYSVGYPVNYTSMSGTSMATPHVAALAGLVALVSPGLATTGIAEQIQRTANSNTAGGGWTPQFGYGIINAAKALSGTLRSAAYGSIQGQVMNSGGLPLTGATVTVGGTSVVTSSTGLFRIPNVTPGQQDVTIAATGYTTVQRTSVVMAGADSLLPVNMGLATGTVQGTISSPSGPVEGAVVQAIQVGVIKAVGFTLPSGQFSIQVPTGPWTLKASAFGYTGATSGSVSVSSGQTVTANLALQPLGRIGGTVRDSSGGLLSNVQVSVTSGSTRAGAVTDSNGTYLTPGLPAGTYTVAADGGSAGTASAPGVSVTNSGTTPVNLSIASPTLSVTPAIAAVPASGQVQYTVVAGGVGSAAAPPVTWTVIPSLGAITTDGLYSAPSAAAPATVQVKAVSQLNPTVTSTATLFVGGSLSLALGGTTVVGGNSVANCQVTLSSPAPAGGITITLDSSNDAVASPPVTVSIPGGSTQSAVFGIATNPVAANTAVNITATLGSMTSTRGLTVQRPSLDSVDLGAASVAGGKTVTLNSVLLTGPAPTGGVSVQLSVSDPAVVAPATAFVPAGASRSNSFDLTTTAVTTAKNVTVTATYGGVARSAVLSLYSADLTGVILSPSSVGGGTVTTSNTVTIGAAAPAGGLTVSLTSSDPGAASVPSTVVVPAGATSAAFSVTTSSVTIDTTVSITASLGTQSMSGTLTVRAPALSSMVVASSSIVGGAVAASNRVVLNAVAPASGVNVSLVSSRPDLIDVPATVAVPGGQSSSALFSLTTNSVTASTIVTITASLNGISKSDTITLRAPALSSITVASTSVVGGALAKSNRVTLDGPAPAAGAVVALASSDPNAVVPASISVAAGQTTSAYFDITTSSVASSKVVTITATYNGVSKTDPLTLRPAALSILSVASSSVAGGVSVPSNRVYLDGPAPDSGAVVMLSSSDPSATPPASITIAAGQTVSAYFTIPTSPVSSAVTATITATYAGVAKTDSLTVRPAGVGTLTISPAVLAGGLASTSNRVILDGPAPAGGAVVLLSSSNPAVAQIPASITVPEGSTTSPYFTVTTTGVLTSTTVTFTASLNGTSKSDDMVVRPPALTGLTISPATLTSGANGGSNRVTLDGPAPASGAVVLLSSSDPLAVAVPVSTLVQPGQTSGPYFTITAGTVSVSKTVTITATYNGVSKTDTVTINP